MGFRIQRVSAQARKELISESKEQLLTMKELQRILNCDDVRLNHFCNANLDFCVIVGKQIKFFKKSYFFSPNLFQNNSEQI